MEEHDVVEAIQGRFNERGLLAGGHGIYRQRLSTERKLTVEERSKICRTLRNGLKYDRLGMESMNGSAVGLVTPRVRDSLISQPVLEVTGVVVLNFTVHFS